MAQPFGPCSKRSFVELSWVVEGDDCGVSSARGSRAARGNSAAFFIREFGKIRGLFQPSLDGLAVEAIFLLCSLSWEPSMLFLLMITPCSSISSSTVTSKSMAELSAQVREAVFTGNMGPREDGGMEVSSSEAEPWSSSSRSLIIPGLPSTVCGDKWADMSRGESSS